MAAQTRRDRSVNTGDNAVCFARMVARSTSGRYHASISSTSYYLLTGPYNDYLFYIFNSPLFDYQAGAFSTSTINQLTVETLNGMEVPLPPPSEQKAIVASLRDKTSQLDRLAEATGRTIALLKERRAALTAAAVTGQVA